MWIRLFNFHEFVYHEQSRTHTRTRKYTRSRVYVFVNSISGKAYTQLDRSTYAAYAYIHKDGDAEANDKDPSYFAYRNYRKWIDLSWITITTTASSTDARAVAVLADANAKEERSRKWDFNLNVQWFNLRRRLLLLLLCVHFEFGLCPIVTFSHTPWLWEREKYFQMSSENVTIHYSGKTREFIHVVYMYNVEHMYVPILVHWMLWMSQY